jgi:hypothetical protein
MDEEGIRRLLQICVSLLFFFSIVLVIPIDDPAIEGVSAGSIWSQTNDGEFLEGTFEGVVVMGSGPSAELKLDLNETGSWKMMSPSMSPEARRGHVVSSIYGMDKVLLFGGFDGNYLGDTWVYDLSDDNWVNKGAVATQPSARHSHAMAFIFGTDKVLLFGGYSEIGFDNETWLYDWGDNSWTNLKPQNPPQAREYHEMESVYNDDKVILFGGYNGSGYLEDTWVYDFSENSWAFFNLPLEPTPRKGHEMATLYGTDEIVLFGGNESGLNHIDDTWVYKQSTYEWINKNPMGEKPAPRRGHSMGCFFNTDQVLLFGPDDQTWIYDAGDNDWDLKSPSINPGPRYVTHAMAPVFNDDKVVLFGGGVDINGSIVNLDDTWVYDLASFEQQGSFLSPQFYMGSDVSLKTIDWVADTPSGTDVKFQIRTAQSEPDLLIKDLVGPTGETNSFYTNSAGENIWLGHSGDTWVQYKIHLHGTLEVSPTISEVNINYNHIPEAPEITEPQDGIWISDTTPYLSWTFNDIDSIQGEFQVQIDDDETFMGIDYDSGEQSSSNEFWQFPMGTSYTDIPDGTWFWKVRTKDTDGDWSIYSTSFMFKIDSLNPTSTITSHSNNGFYNNIDAIYGTAYDNGGSGIENVKIQITRLSDGYSWTGTSWGPATSWLDCAGSDSWEYDSSSVSWETHNRYSIEVFAIDIAHNQQTEGHKIEFSFDSEIPEIMVDPSLSGAYLTELDTISGSAEDFGGSGLDRIEVRILRNSDGKIWNGNSFSDEEHWEPAKGTESWSYDSKEILWSSDISYTVLARAIDNVGNSKTTTDGTTFVIDYIEPFELQITINNGDTFTKDTEVSLSLSAKDQGSGISQMDLSSDGVNWGGWEDFSVTRLYVLGPGDGAKNIYFRVQDKAGNIADPVFSTIVLDTTEPEVVEDKDEDGILDESDAFPEDPAASIDSDSDGYPDSWNPGKTQGHSTSGLTLDEYPSDPLRHTLEIEDEDPKEATFETIPFLIVPLIAIILLLVFLFVFWRSRKKAQDLWLNMLKKFK